MLAILDRCGDRLLVVTTMGIVLSTILTICVGLVAR
jgi:hypothetical protein